MTNGSILNLLMHQTAVHLFAFFGLDLPQVKLKLLALKDVAICPSTLTRSGGNASCRRVENSVMNFIHGRNKLYKHI